MPSYDLINEIAKAPLPTPEHMLGRGCLMPFNPSNSGMRKIMFGINLEQRLPIMDPEVPYVSTGFEYQYGQLSSSFTVADDGYSIVASIPKFSNVPKNHVFHVLVSDNGTKVRYLEACQYKHSTENYGYLYSKSCMNFRPGDHIRSGDVLLKSTSFDEYNNRKDGKNMLVLYNSSEQTMEDGIIISESAAKKMASPLIHKFKIVLNDNDIPLNLYGNYDNYKVMPDIGEVVKDSVFMAYRREKKEESLYSQTYSRMMSLSLSDETIICNGKLVDINVYSNDPSKMNIVHFGQIKYYWEEQLKFARAFVDTVKPIIASGAKPDYALEALMFKCEGMLAGKQFFNERVFSSLTLEVTIIEEIPVKQGVA